MLTDASKKATLDSCDERLAQFGDTSLMLVIEQRKMRKLADPGPDSARFRPPRSHNGQQPQSDLREWGTNQDRVCEPHRSNRNSHQEGTPSLRGMVLDDYRSRSGKVTISR